MLGGIPPIPMPMLMLLLMPLLLLLVVAAIAVLQILLDVVMVILLDEVMATHHDVLGPMRWLGLMQLQLLRLRGPN